MEDSVRRRQEASEYNAKILQRNSDLVIQFKVCHKYTGKTDQPDGNISRSATAWMDTPVDKYGTVSKVTLSNGPQYQRALLAGRKLVGRMEREPRIRRSTDISKSLTKVSDR